jgi:6-phosphogluconolactonase
MRGELKRFPNLDELSKAAAANMASLIEEAVGKRGSCSIALSGGNTPRTLHHLLATRHRDEIPWGSVQIFFGDERYVPHSDKSSNYLMAKETLLDLVPIPEANIHAIRTDLSGPQKAAATYERTLRKFFQDVGSTFDLLLLGMGKEGHTASLFPHSKALDECRKWVMAVDVPATPSKRITTTYPLLNRSASIYFLVTGSDKTAALREVLDSESDYRIFPARGIESVNGRLVWWVDSSAYPVDIACELEV